MFGTYKFHSNNYINKNNNNKATKRLPSPQIHSNLSKTQKLNGPKYRAPSPMIKSNININNKMNNNKISNNVYNNPNIYYNTNNFKSKNKK